MWILEFSELLYVVTFIPAITDLHRIVMKAVAVLDAYLMIARTIISNGHLNQAGTVINIQISRYLCYTYSIVHRTSPVTVPSTNRLRQRQESSSSLSVGSWQMITGTGSYRSAESVNEMHSHLQQNPGHNNCPNHQHHHHHHHHNHQNQNQNFNSNNQQPASNHSLQFNLSGTGSSAAGPSNSASTPNANQNHIPSQTTSCCTTVDGECYANRLDLFAM